MFKDVGKELKGIAENYVISRRNLAALLCGIITILGAVVSGPTYFVHILLGLSLVSLIIVLIVYEKARMKAIEYYAYGELVDRVTLIERAINGSPTQEINPPPVSTPAPAPASVSTSAPPPASKPVATTWFCRSCGAENANWALTCKKCGKHK